MRRATLWRYPCWGQHDPSSWLSQNRVYGEGKEMWMCHCSVYCFHLSSSLFSCSDSLCFSSVAAFPDSSSNKCSMVLFPVWSTAKDRGCKALEFSLYGKEYCKIVSASEAENCVRCLNRFPRFFSSKPFIHQVGLWCTGHLWSPSIAQCLSVAVGVCQRERLRADFPRAARRAHHPWYPRSTPTLQRLDRLLKKP